MSYSDNLSVEIDKTGFPLIRMGHLPFSFHVWPVTKYQYEQFICNQGGFDDSWYETINRLNPRIPASSILKKNYEGALVTGILPEEAMRFARYNGKEYDLPTVEEWRIIYMYLDSVTSIKYIQSAINSITSNAVQQKLSSLSQKPLQYFLLRDGIVEWVKQESNYVGLGAPRLKFFANALNPLKDLVEPHDINGRLHYFGFRLLKRQTN